MGWPVLGTYMGSSIVQETICAPGFWLSAAVEAPPCSGCLRARSSVLPVTFPAQRAGYLADGRWGCFRFPAVMCAAAVSIPMAVRVWTCFQHCWVTTRSGSKPVLTLWLTFCGTVGLLLSSLFNFGQVTPLPRIPRLLSPP